MLSTVYGCAVVGLNPILINIETHISPGVRYQIVGLPDNAVRESFQRIEAAITTLGYKMPRQKIIINMAPADIRKEGSYYDLPLALGILSASGQIPADTVSKYLVMGELSLQGAIRPIKGVLSMALKAVREGLEGIIVPHENAKEASIVAEIKAYGFSHLKEVISFLQGQGEGLPETCSVDELFLNAKTLGGQDISLVRGQRKIKRALEIAAAGGHNIIFIGPPGVGKTMLAQCLPTILPPLTLNESLETSQIYSVAGKLSGNSPILFKRPFRGPHHNISDVALIGGGNQPNPGEVSLAHNGVLFLDELPEFKRSVQEALRQPLEDDKVVVSRARYSVAYPCSFMLVASMNPCPCGYYNHPNRDCTCTPTTIRKYLSKISGPLLDRIDIQLEVSPVSFTEFSSPSPSETSAVVRARVMKARALQTRRYYECEGVYTNARMDAALIQKFCALDRACSDVLKIATEKMNLSTRAYTRILKLARTIADLENQDTLQVKHVAEAIQYRNLDRTSWLNA